MELTYTCRVIDIRTLNERLNGFRALLRRKHRPSLLLRCTVAASCLSCVSATPPCFWSPLPDQLSQLPCQLHPASTTTTLTPPLFICSSPTTSTGRYHPTGTTAPLSPCPVAAGLPLHPKLWPSTPVLSVSVRNTLVTPVTLRRLKGQSGFSRVPRLVTSNGITRVSLMWLRGFPNETGDTVPHPSLPCPYPSALQASQHCLQPPSEAHHSTPSL